MSDDDFRDPFLEDKEEDIEEDLGDEEEDGNDMDDAWDNEEGEVSY